MFELADQFSRCFNGTYQIDSGSHPSFGVIAFLTYVQPIVAFIGIVGNIFIITLLNASLKETSCIFYLRCLAVFDCLSITAFQCSFYPLMVLRVFFMAKFKYAIMAIDTYFSRPGVCQVTVFVSFTSRTLSTWTVVVFTLERLVAVVWPLRAIKCFTLRRSRFYIVVTVLVSILVNTPWFLALETSPDPCCTGEFVCKPTEVINVNRIFETLFLSVLPTTVICSANAVILYRIRYRPEPGNLGCPTLFSSKRLSTTIQLLSVSFCFVVLTLPSAVINVIQTFNHFLGTWKGSSGVLADTYYIAWFLFMINLSINVFVYCLVRKSFRDSAFGLFRRRTPLSFANRDVTSRRLNAQLETAS